MALLSLSSAVLLSSVVLSSPSLVAARSLAQRAVWPPAHRMWQAGSQNEAHANNYALPSTKRKHSIGSSQDFNRKADGALPDPIRSILELTMSRNA